MTDHKHTPGPYAVQAGRCITLNGKPFVSIHRIGETYPTAADEFTHDVARWANAEASAPDLLAERDHLRAECERLRAVVKCGEMIAMGVDLSGPDIPLDLRKAMADFGKRASAALARAEKGEC